MTKESQNTWVANELLTHGQVSRNAALKRYITRLAARCNDLRKVGYKIEGSFVKTKNGKDFVYRLITDV